MSGSDRHLSPEGGYGFSDADDIPEKYQARLDPFGDYSEQPRQCSECGSWFTGEHFCWGGTP